MKNVTIGADLVPLERAELENINGGLVFWATVAAGICVAGAAEIISNWDRFKAGLAGRC